MPLDEEPPIFADVESTEVKDDAGAAKAAEKPASAESSTAADVSKAVEPDTLSIVRDVVQGKDTAEASSAKSQEEGKQPDDQAAKDADDEDFSDVPFHKHPRFQKVLGDLKAAKVDATRYRNVETFIGEQGLSAEQAADVLTIAGLMRTNPAEAWKRMKPKVEELLIAAGEILPDDLKTRVASGELSREAAIELSRTKATVKSHELIRGLEAERASVAAAESHKLVLQGAAYEWAVERNTRDPNFEAKLPAIYDQAELLKIREGVPGTPQGVKEQLRRAYEKVNATFIVPQAANSDVRPAVTPVTGGRTSAATTPAAPKNTLDIIQQELARSRA